MRLPHRIRSNEQPSNRLHDGESDTEDAPYMEEHGVEELNLTLPSPAPPPPFPCPFLFSLFVIVKLLDSDSIL